MTLHEKMLQDIVHERCATDAAWVQIVSQVVRKLQDQYWSQQYVNSFMQKWDRFDYDIYDAYAFAQFHTAVHTGRIVHAAIEIAETPKPDRQKSANNKALQSLKSPFSAEFVGGSVDDDGVFCWDSSIELERTVDDSAMVPKRVVIPPGTVPLEVGYTGGSRTLLHLAQERGVARWPYGSRLIYLYLTIDDELWYPLLGPSIIQGVEVPQLG